MTFGFCGVTNSSPFWFVGAGSSQVSVSDVSVSVQTLGRSRDIKVKECTEWQTAGKNNLGGMSRIEIQGPIDPNEARALDFCVLDAQAAPYRVMEPLPPDRAAGPCGPTVDKRCSPESEDEEVDLGKQSVFNSVNHPAIPLESTFVIPAQSFR